MAWFHSITFVRISSLISMLLLISVEVLGLESILLTWREGNPGSNFQTIPPICSWFRDLSFLLEFFNPFRLCSSPISCVTLLSNLLHSVTLENSFFQSSEWGIHDSTSIFWNSKVWLLSFTLENSILRGSDPQIRSSFCFIFLSSARIEEIDHVFNSLNKEGGSWRFRRIESDLYLLIQWVCLRKFVHPVNFSLRFDSGYEFMASFLLLCSYEIQR